MSNKLEKDRLGLRDLGHLDHPDQDLLDLQDRVHPDHRGADLLAHQDLDHPDHPSQAHLEVDQRKEEALLDRVKADLQKEDLPVLPKADHLDQRKEAHPDQRKEGRLDHRRADRPDQRNQDHLGQRREDLRRAGRRKAGHLALNEALQTEEVSD